MDFKEEPAFSDSGSYDCRHFVKTVLNLEVP